MIALSTDPAQLIRSSDPRDRVNGIKIVARMQNERALRVLLGLAESDPEPRVREYARKGAQYVARKMEERGLIDVDEGVVVEEAAAETYEEEAEAEPQPVEVTAAQVQRAQGYVNTAFDHHMNGNKEKATRALTKALQTNPNLRFDDYFKSVATSVTGLDAVESVRALSSEKRSQNLISAAQRQKQSAAVGDHMAEAEKYTWGKISLDLGILSAIAFFGMFFAILVTSYSINAFIDSREAFIQEEFIAVEEAQGSLTDEQREQRAQVELAIEQVRGLTGVLGLPLALVMGFGTWLAIFTSILTFSFSGHLIAKALGGQGTLPYLLYNLLMAYNIPLLAMFIALMLAPVLAFIALIPARFALIAVALAMAIILLVISFRVNGGIKRAYHFGMGKAYLTYLIAGIPASIVVIVVGFIMSLIAGGIIGAALEPLLESLPSSPA